MTALSAHSSEKLYINAANLPFTRALGRALFTKLLEILLCFNNDFHVRHLDVWYK